MQRSITFRLIIAFLLVSITVVALASGITYWLTILDFKQLTFDQARDRFVADMTFYYQTHGSWDGVLDYYRLRASTSSQLDTGPGSQPPGPPPAGQSRIQTFFFALADQDGRILIPAGSYRIGETIAPVAKSAGTPISLNNVQVGTVVVLGNPPPLGPLEESYLNRTNLALLYAVLGASTLALILGIVLARALTYPIRDLTKGIRGIARGEFAQNVTVTSRDELGELATAFNQMSKDLDRLTQSRRQMTADIAHDLRNPLTVIGGYVESMREGVLQPTPERLNAIQSEVKHLERLVDDLRILSKADAGELSLNRGSVSIPSLLQGIEESYRALANKQGVSLKIEADSALPEIKADSDRLAQVLGNLVTNSLRYTPAGGQISISGKAAGNSVVITITDNGQGIPSEAVPYVFERFYRADPSRTGGEESGLGLAIAKSIIDAHGGSINAESPAGGGTTIRIILPQQ